MITRIWALARRCQDHAMRLRPPLDVTAPRATALATGWLE
jgi:hypothetical protein